jgi:hypothetical protein
MAESTGLAKPQLLTIPQLADIHQNHAPTANAIIAIVDYINKNVAPVQGNKKAPK